MSNCQTSVYIYSFFFSYLCAPPIWEGRPPGVLIPEDRLDIPIDGRMDIPEMKFK